MHICGAAQGRQARFYRKLQSVLEDAYRFAQAALRAPDIRQGHAAADHIRDEPVPLQVGHPPTERLEGGIEIAAGPGRKPEQRCAGAPQEIVILRRELEQAAGVLHTVRHIALRQGQGGTVHGDRAGHALEFLLVHKFGLFAGFWRHVQPALDLLKARLHSLQVPVLQ